MGGTAISSLSLLFKSKKTRTKAFRMLRFAFAHHPTCTLFRNHIYKVRNVWICKGCAITYPLALFSFITAYFIGLELSTGYNVVLLMLILSIIASLGFFPNRFALISRGTRGIFSGLYFYCFVIVGDFVLFILGLIILNFILMFFVSIRYLKMTKTCKNCIYEGNWDICEGFFDLRKELFTNTIWELDTNPPEPARVKFHHH